MTSAPLALANITALLPHYDSAAEEWWSTFGPALIGDELRCPVAVTHHHALTFSLPGGSYAPDFTHILQDGRLIQVEVKGSKEQKNYRDARSKLRAAAALYPWITWFEARIAGGNYELELIEEQAWAT